MHIRQTSSPVWVMSRCITCSAVACCLRSCYHTDVLALLTSKEIMLPSPWKEKLQECSTLTPVSGFMFNSDISILKNYTQIFHSHIFENIILILLKVAVWIWAWEDWSHWECSSTEQPQHWIRMMCSRHFWPKYNTQDLWPKPSDRLDCPQKCLNDSVCVCVCSNKTWCLQIVIIMFLPMT